MELSCLLPEWCTGEISICIVTGINCGPAPKKHPGALPVGVVGVDDEPVPQRWSIRRSVASLTLAASHSHPLITAIVVWKFFCFWRNVSCMLYWSWMVRRKGSLGSKTVSKLDIIGKSKVKLKKVCRMNGMKCDLCLWFLSYIKGVNSRTRALAFSTPSISPEFEILRKRINI